MKVQPGCLCSAVTLPGESAGLGSGQPWVYTQCCNITWGWTVVTIAGFQGTVAEHKGSGLNVSLLESRCQLCPEFFFSMNQVFILTTATATATATATGTTTTKK